MTKYRLVSEDGERNLWDDILDEQLSKCPRVQTRRIGGNAQTAGDRPSIVTTSDEAVLVASDREEGGEAKTAEEGEALNEEELDDGERGGGGVARVEEDGARPEEGVPRESSSSGLGFGSSIPSLGLLRDAMQQLQQLHQQRMQQQQKQQEQTEVGYSLAPKYAFLLSQACRSMLDITQGTDVDNPVVRAVRRAAAAASAAQDAVSEAMSLLDTHSATGPGGTSATSKQKRRCLSPTSPSACETAQKGTDEEGGSAGNGSGRSVDDDRLDGVHGRAPGRGEEDRQGLEGEGGVDGEEIGAWGSRGCCWFFRLEQSQRL